MTKVIPFVESHFALAKPLSMEVYYPLLWEPEDAFRIRMRLFPNGCLSLFEDETYAGYVFGHPWKGDHIPLATVIDSLPDQPDHYYIHDLLIGRQFQGKGFGTMLYAVSMAVAYSAGLREIRLVSVLDSERFWMKQGFTTVKEFEYADGVPAKLMVNKVGV